MTLDEAVRQLKSSDPTIRRQAVIDIGKSKNPSMLSVLADVYKNDSDPDVRNIALKAGQYIKANMGPGAAEPVEAPSASPLSTAPRVSDMNRERASSYLSQALDYQMRGDILKASETLGRAFDFNPGLADDPLAKNLAADLTGQGPTPAVRTFMDKNARAQFMATKGGRKVPGDGTIALATPESEEIGWGGAILDLFIYGLAVGALSFIIIMVGFQPLVELMARLSTQQSSMSSAEAQMMQQQLELLRSVSSLGLALPIALASGVGAIISLLIECGIEHLIVKSALGGSGLLTSLIHKLAFFQIVLIPIGGILGLLFVLVLMPQFERDPQSIQPLFPILWVLGMGFGIFTLYYRARLIGKNYSISTGKGCLTIFLYTIVVFLRQISAQVTLGGVVGSMFNSSGSGF